MYHNSSKLCLTVIEISIKQHKKVFDCQEFVDTQFWPNLYSRDSVETSLRPARLCRDTFRYHLECQKLSRQIQDSREWVETNQDTFQTVEKSLANVNIGKTYVENLGIYLWQI